MDRPVAQLLRRYEELEASAAGGDAGDLLFGWQCENPFVGRLLEAARNREAQLDHTRYTYVEDDRGVTLQLKDLHACFDGISPEAVFCGPGGSVSILFTFSVYLHSLGVREVYYVPPLYFTLHYALNLFGIRARAVARLHPIEPQFSMNLPSKKTVLLLTDPVWYAGRTVPEAVMDTIEQWQLLTGSLIFVDGSFQYMRWDCKTREISSQLHRGLTFRLICPTKQLGVHGYRFAYTLLPEGAVSKFTTTYANIYGSTASANSAFAQEAVKELRDRSITNSLVCRAQKRHTWLREQGKTVSVFQPDCGYFTFEEIKADLPEQHLLMTGEYFDQPRYQRYSRLNLLSPSFYLLD